MSSSSSSSNSETKKNDDDHMTLAEREEWLRERGVMIETPEDRNSASGDGAVSVVEQMLGRASLGSDNNDNENDDGSVEFVCIPSDETKPIRSLRLPKPSKPGDALPLYVKPYFADRKAIDASLLKEQATKHFAGGDLGQLADTKLSPAAMNAVAAQGAVETFPLVRPADTNGHQGVYVYLDEVGLLKKLPQNPRASAIAAACGYHPAPSFYGDVFVGRVGTKPTMRNVDFCVGADTDKGAEWMRRAISENLSWQQEMNRVTGKEGATQPGQLGTDGKAAEEESYAWTQDEDELEIVVPGLAGEGTPLNKKAVKVVFLPRSVKILYGGEERVKVALYGAVDVDGCTWTIEAGRNLVVTCEKANCGEMWPRIQAGGPSSCSTDSCGGCCS